MSLALWGAGIGTAIAILAILWVAARHALTLWRERKLLIQAKHVRAALDEARAKEFDGLDKMLFDMRDVYASEVIEAELGSSLSTTAANSPKLVQAFAVLGITDRYLTAVRGAKSWQARARAAITLGLLGEVRAVKVLVEGMRDSREDADVKLACAEALGRIKSKEVVPILVEELEHLDDWSSPRLAAVLISFGELAVEPLLAALNSATSLNVRVWAAQVLGKLGDLRAVPSLLARIHDRSDALRTSVTNALGDLKDARAVRPLIESVLRDPSATVRAQSAAALGRIGDVTAVPLLVVALGDLEHWVRLRALEAIEAIAPEDTSPIEVALDDPNREVRFRAALALDRLGMLEQAFSDLAGDDEARAIAAQDRLIAVGRAGLSERFIGHVEDDDPKVRARIIAVLGAVANPAHAAPLIKRLADSDRAARLAAIEALASIGDKATATALMGVMRDSVAPEADAARDALLRHEGRVLAQIESELTGLASHERDDVRAAAVRLLGLIPGESVDGHLRAALFDRFVEVQFAAVNALGERAVEGAADEIGEALQSPVAALQIAAAEALGKVGGNRAIQLLVAVMPRAQDKFRDAVCAALAGFGWDAVYPAFDVLLASEDIAARIGLVWMLGKTADTRAVRILRMLLREPDAKVRSAAAGALGKIIDPKAAEALAIAVVDPSPFVRAAAVNSLGTQRAPVRIISPLLNDPDSFVRTRAALALGKIGGDEVDAALAAVRPGDIEPHVIAVARGVAGTQAGVAATLRALQQAALLRDLNALLNAEPPEIRQQFRANLALDTDGSAGDVALAAVVERYISTLNNSSDVDARRTAVRAIAELADPAAIAALTTALRDDPDRDVRHHAALGLGGRSNVHVRGALLGAVHDPDSRVRLAAIRGLGTDLAPRDSGPLFDALASVDAEVVAAAERALTTIHGEAGALPVVEDWMMAQESEPLICSGLRILGGIADSHSLRAIQAQTRAGSSAIRIEAVRSLAALGLPAAVRSMMVALEDPVVAVRVAVVHALRKVTRADVIERLQLAMSDPSPEVRISICSTLSASSSSEAAAMLSQLAADRETSVSSAAVVGLLTLPDSEGLAAIVNVWPSLVSEVRANVRQKMASGIDRLSNTIATSLEAAPRETAVRVLALIDATANAERIAKALGDPDGRVRLAAVQSLADLEHERVGDWLAKLHDDPVQEVRMAARRKPLKLV